MNDHPVLLYRGIFFCSRHESCYPALQVLWTTRVLTSHDFDANGPSSPSQRERWMDTLYDEYGERSEWPTNAPSPVRLYAHCERHFGAVFKVAMRPLSRSTRIGWTARVQFFSVDHAQALDDHVRTHRVLGWSVLVHLEFSS